MSDKQKKCRWCGEVVTGRTFGWPIVCGGVECNEEQDQCEREQLENAREAAFEDGYERYM